MTGRSSSAAAAAAAAAGALPFAYLTIWIVACWIADVKS